MDNTYLTIEKIEDFIEQWNSKIKKNVQIGIRC